MPELPAGGRRADHRAGFAFVGREEELRRLLEALREGPAVVFVEGGAGTGKSRLLREAENHLADRSLPVLSRRACRQRAASAVAPRRVAVTGSQGRAGGVTARRPAPARVGCARHRRPGPGTARSGPARPLPRSPRAPRCASAGPSHPAEAALPPAGGGRVGCPYA
ncbi:AAA family ATPase [Streptomyces sp. MS06]|uniref:AAA family ATPase n=1 Tax=Streptomyces sp. MS06 TaxID=3385974 RepID=UPI0039A19A74